MKLEIGKIPIEMYRTTHKKDAFGNRVRGQEKYMGFKKLKCVSTGRRFAHFLIDYICFYIIYIGISFVFGLIAILTKADPVTTLSLQSVGMLIGVLLFPTYYFLFEFFFQKTPGKFITQTTVVNKYGEKLTSSEAILRSIIRLVPFEALSCFSDSNRGWHDRWSETYVLEKKEYDEIQQLLAERNPPEPWVL